MGSSSSDGRGIGSFCILQKAFKKEFDSADEKSQRTAENFARKFTVSLSERISMTLGETEKEWGDQEKVSTDMVTSMKALRGGGGALMVVSSELINDEGMLNEYSANTDKQAHELTEETRQKQAAIKKEISEAISRVLYVQ